jgi:hypothetical protein
MSSSPAVAKEFEYSVAFCVDESEARRECLTLNRIRLILCILVPTRDLKLARRRHLGRKKDTLESNTGSVGVSEIEEFGCLLIRRQMFEDLLLDR